MKRADITALFPEATDEQVNALMKIHGDDVNAVKKASEELQTSLAEAQKALAEAQKDTSAKDLEKAQAKLKELQAEIEQRNAADALREVREAVATEAGIPVNLLTGTTKEECETQAKSIMEFAGAVKQSYPTVHDAGEAHVDVKPSTRQQFAEWANAAFNN
jgi:DNA repair exonuclease SbcCD ATPase subunit